MRTILLMPILIMFFIILLCSAAHASSYNEEVQKLYSPQLIEAIIKQQMRHKHDLRPIDGNLPAIEISRCAGDCMDMPPSKQQMREKYVGR